MSTQKAFSLVLKLAGLALLVWGLTGGGFIAIGLGVAAHAFADAIHGKQTNL